MNSGWRKINKGEVFEPGRRFRVNLSAGETYVWEDNFGGGTASMDPSTMEGADWREFVGNGGDPTNPDETYGGNASTGGAPSSGYNFQSRTDPFDRDPQFRRVAEQAYNDWVVSESKVHPDNPVTRSFDEFWNIQTDEARMAMYKSMKRGYKQRIKGLGGSGRSGAAKTAYDQAFQDALDEAMVAGIYAGREGTRRTTKKSIRESDGKGGYTNRVVDVTEEYDPQTREWNEVGPKQATAWEIRFRTKEAQAKMSQIESDIKNMEARERLRPQTEELLGRDIEYQNTLLRQAQRAKKWEPVKKLIVQPVAEIVSGGMKAVAGDRMSVMKYGKGAMNVAQKAFVPSPGTGTYRESPLRPAPRSRFTTPMVSSVPSRMPITTTRSGKKIPAGEAIIAPARMVKEAVIKPTVAGSLLTTSVGKMPAAQALVPQKPARLGLSNLRVGVDTSGIRRGGALPSLRIRTRKKNLYNEQLRKIRGLLR
jgi:hypothetical protein